MTVTVKFRESKKAYLWTCPDCGYENTEDRSPGDCWFIMTSCLACNTKVAAEPEVPPPGWAEVKVPADRTVTFRIVIRPEP